MKISIIYLILLIFYLPFGISKSPVISYVQTISDYWHEKYGHKVHGGFQIHEVPMEYVESRIDNLKIYQLKFRNWGIDFHGEFSYFSFLLEDEITHIYSHVDLLDFLNKHDLYPENESDLFTFINEFARLLDGRIKVGYIYEWDPFVVHENLDKNDWSFVLYKDESCWLVEFNVYSERFQEHVVRYVLKLCEEKKVEVINRIDYGNSTEIVFKVADGGSLR